MDGGGDGNVGDNDGYDAGDDDSMNGASTATNLSAKSQASIQTIAESVAESVDGLPLPDGGLMLIELVEGVYRLTVAGMNYFNTVAEIAGGYGPIASIAFISLLSANPKLLPTLSLPTMDLTGIASQIGLTANAAARRLQRLLRRWLRRRRRRQKRRRSRSNTDDQNNNKKLRWL